ncbi:HTH-type transcriptional repressor ComR [Actinomadura rubteroloni]|uniref:HTH-type transcriptional repressor ComR n=1 Tax=Actinomadura rubteroloni TaxID=1926885 RepID=A0A2P4UMN3_9ACTN|nr:TetR/AcrR family transcriptional regulator [Actinomadura rubteroloni]POM26306.1 HTH-type transcriptional repressor ComR [Actinomadura rubteroloni]
MTTSSPTRDRIIDAAMELFGAHGFRGTSVAKIEAAAGLTPGAGGLYHHFRSKEDLLRAGIDRHLARLHALRDIRATFTGVGDLRTELTLTARYVLAELDEERELLQILAAEARSRPDLVRDAVNQLLGTSQTGFAAQLADLAGLSPDRADAVAVVALGALFSARMPRDLFNATPALDDETFIRTWVEMLSALVAS